ncbi:MAG: alanine--tRNA ligase-related protein, partial [Candidatus Parcubacteria bacterium]|nr:alanine--tRNA ligase-related protein [Candidatus Parcubacteria bacterium]
MNSQKLRQEFLKFFEKKGHKVTPSSSLLPTDPSVLLTTAGMQQFKPYYIGTADPLTSPHPALGGKPLGSKNAVSIQKSFRTSDIEEVGDKCHLTFFEMMGNFSFGGYFKEEAIKYGYELIKNVFKLKIDYVTVFDPAKVPQGDWRKEGVPFDSESYEFWKKIGMPEDKIRREGVDNFWGPTGDEGPCGPTTEIYVNGMEIWNIVFNQFYCDKDKKLTLLKIQGVDTGMGFERLAIMSQKKTTVYETDLFGPIIREIEKNSSKSYSEDKKSFRIIADHIRGAVFLASDGILPSNVERGYILRRIIRRAIRFGKLLNLPKNFIIPLAKVVVKTYKDAYPELHSRETDILTILQNEEEKFEKTLEIGLNETISILSKGNISGEEAFHIYETYGFPLELIEELATEKGKEVDRSAFAKAFEKHQELSRTSAAGMFKGGLADTGEKTVKYHTANHLLLAALRQILGPEIYQKGSNITAERLRFDFNFPQKLNEEQI